jgi:phage gpG-like protein
MMELRLGLHLLEDKSLARYSGRSLGSFGELGGEIVFDWEPDVSVIENELLEIEGYLENIAGPLLLSKGVLQNDIRMRFETKVDPDGTPWEPWSENYEKYRERYYPEGGILVRTGELESAATSEAAYIVSDAGIFYNTAGLPEYWLWNQEGRERGKGVSQEDIEFAKRARAAGMQVDESQLGGSNTLPARPFVGVSFEAELEVIEIFDQWFDGAIQLGTSNKGKVFGRYSYRGAGGRFTKRVQ